MTEIVANGAPEPSTRVLFSPENLRFVHEYPSGARFGFTTDPDLAAAAVDALGGQAVRRYLRDRVTGLVEYEIGVPPLEESTGEQDDAS